MCLRSETEQIVAEKVSQEIVEDSLLGSIRGIHGKQKLIFQVLLLVVFVLGLEIYDLLLVVKIKGFLYLLSLNALAFGTL